MMVVLRTLGLACAIGFLTLPDGAIALEGSALNEVAVAAVRPAGAPDYADVCLRYGWVRSSFPSVQDAKDAIRDFHATRVDWFYPGPHAPAPGVTYVTPEAQDFINWCHANGMKIGGAMNTNTTHLEWRLEDGPSGRYIGDPKNQDYLDAAVAWGKAQIDAGVDTLVCDDFFYYNSSEKQLFSDNVIAVIKAYQPGFMIAGNSGSTIGTDYVVPYAFDFHYSDNNFTPDPSDMWTAAKAHRAQQSTFLMHPNRSMTTAARRTLLALGYGVGAHLIAPWDEWLSGGAPRLFADPADFADLYGFARALGQLGLLNGYEDAAVGGYDLTETRYGAAPPISVTGGSGSLSVFARAQPGQPEAAVVFHLVESGTAQAATLRVKTSALFDTTNVTCTLYTPPAYNQTAHDTASTSGDYSSLASASTLSSTRDGDEIVIALPAMVPWGALVIEPSADRHSLNVSPAGATVMAGETQAFTATVVDSSGNPLSPQPTITWEVTGGGSIDGTGLFTAGSWAATSTVTATAVLDGGETVIGSQTIDTQGDSLASTVAYWNTAAADDATLTDLTGNGYDLTGGANTFNQSGVAIVPIPLPNPNSPDYSASGSIYINGGGLAAKRTDNVFKMTSSSSFTFEGWFTVTSGDSIRVIGGDRQGNSSPGYNGWYVNVTTSNKLQFYAQFASGTQSVTTSGEVTGSAHHFAAVWDHDAISENVGVMRLYLDGSLVGTSAPFTPDAYTQSFFAVNGRSAGTDGIANDGIFAAGDRFDELRFSNGALLSPSEFLNGSMSTYADYAGDNGGSTTLPTADDNSNGVQDGVEYAFYEALGTGVKLDSPGQLGRILFGTLDDMETPDEVSDDHLKYAVLLPATPPTDVIYRVYASSVAPLDPGKTLLATYSGSWETEAGVTMETGPNSEDVIVDPLSPSTSARRFVWLELEVTSL